MMTIQEAAENLANMIRLKQEADRALDAAEKETRKLRDAYAAAWSAEDQAREQLYALVEKIKDEIVEAKTAQRPGNEGGDA